MILLGDKIFIRITNESRDGIFSKEVTRNDGSKTKLFINVPTDSIDERHASLFVSTGIVEQVAPSVKHIQVGDVVIIDYTLCNDESKFVYKDENGSVYWAHANTSYHKESLIANQTRKSRRDQIVHLKGEMDEISMILGVIHKGVLTANDPYIFLEHESNLSSLITTSGIHYNKTERLLNRRVLSISQSSKERTGIEQGDIVLVNDPDIFMVKYEGLVVDCINDTDCFCVKKTGGGLKAV